MDDADAKYKYKLACEACKQAEEEKNEATLTLSQATRKLEAADKVLEAAKEAKDEALNALDKLEAKAAAKRETDSGGDSNGGADGPIKPPAKKKAKKSHKNNVSDIDERNVEVVTLQQLMKEKGMEPSRKETRPCNYERKLLRFYAAANIIKAKPEGQKNWEWKRGEEDFTRVEKILEKFKSGVRVPHKFEDKLRAGTIDWDKYGLE